MEELLSTKTSIARTRAPLVARKRLSCELERALDEASVVFVIAPAGYGKTTLLQTWHGSDAGPKRPLAWLSLDADDSEPRRFLRYVLAALRAVGYPEHSATSRMLLDLSGSPIRSVLVSLINEIANIRRDFVLAIDDYHVINDAEVDGAVQFLVEHMPDNMRLVILSRTMPQMPVARWKARGAAYVVKADTLLFNEDEVARLGELYAGANLDACDAAALAKKTEGWAAALRLVFTDAGSNVTSWRDEINSISDNRDVMDYLLAEFYGSLPASSRKLLVAASLFERFCPELLACLLNDDVREVARSLESLGEEGLLVVALGGSGHWYRLHNLLRTFLSTQVTREGLDAQCCLKQACEWFAAHDCAFEQAQCAVKADDWPWALPVLEEIGERAVLEGRFTFLREMMSCVPADVVDGSPALVFLSSLVPSLSGVAVRRAAVLRRAALLEEGPCGSGSTDKSAMRARLLRCNTYMVPDRTLDMSDYLRWALGARDIVSSCALPASAVFQHLGCAYAAQGDLALARDAFERSVEHARTSGDLCVLAESRGLLADVLIECGDLRSASEMLRSTHDEFVELGGDAMPPVGVLSIMEARIAAERGNFEDACSLAREGLLTSAGAAIPYFSFLGTACEAISLCALGRKDEARLELQRLEESWLDVHFVAEAFRAWDAVHCRLGEDCAAVFESDRFERESREWFRAMEPCLDGAWHMPGVGLCAGSQQYFYSYIVWALTSEQYGCASKGISWIDTYVTFAEERGMRLRMVWLLATRAVLHRGMRCAQAALDDAAAAIDLAGALSVPLPFFIDGRVLDLVREVSNDAALGSDRALFAADVLGLMESAACGDIAAGSKQPVSLDTGLTSREKTVLVLLGRGLSNAEISDELVISKATTKTHVTHILQKLGASNRTQAVAAARNMGLL